MTTTSQILEEIDFALASREAALKRAQHDDLSDLGTEVIAEIVATLNSTIQRLSPSGSPYLDQAVSVMTQFPPRLAFKAHGPLSGVLRALRQAYERGYLSTVEELVHADMFADFLEMAEHLLESKYKDPAAVIIGGVIEEHLRKLCLKNTLPIINSSGKALKASQMNDDLAKIAYDKLQQKGVTYWLDLRNKAAHGKYTEYDEKEVRQMLVGVRDFLNKFRA
jgi:hypothetical protein